MRCCTPVLAGAPDAEGCAAAPCCLVDARCVQSDWQDQSERALEASKKSSHRTEDLARQLHQLQEDLGASLRERNQLHEAVEQLTVQFREDVFRQSQRHLELEGLIEDRNNEIKLLMYRLQELSSRYVPVKADATDMVLSRWINGYRPAVPFFRLAQGLYLFGRRQVVCKISNDKPVFRIGGGFVGFEKFLEQFAAEELERLLTYELAKLLRAAGFVSHVANGAGHRGAFARMRRQASPSSWWSGPPKHPQVPLLAAVVKFWPD
ncbi:unnamed protein product [Symbiodinium sp. CCMP2456]|nr:unnamed protein product [Symbiodinium sp. CCMP2456]